MFNKNLCELNQVHRFHGNTLLQDAHKCANGETMDLIITQQKNTTFPYAGLIRQWIH